MRKDEKQFYSVAEAAKKLGVSRIAVFKRIKKGDIKAMRVGRIYVISPKAFYEFRVCVLGNKKRKR